jgi:uncharacterized protein CbrC (UPF0167 family)
MAEALPTFRYHPDPVATGSVEASDAECPCCERARGHVYVGPVYAEDELVGLCPWCIADGSAAERLGAGFADVDGDVPDEVRTEIGERTPSFTGWQQERWLVHCGDACAFLGRMGQAELVEAIHPDGDLTAYRFRCLHCGAHLAYTDAS